MAWPATFLLAPTTDEVVTPKMMKQIHQSGVGGLEGALLKPKPFINIGMISRIWTKKGIPAKTYSRD